MGKADKFETGHPTRIPGDLFEKQENRRIRGERLEVSFYVEATHRGHPIQGYIEAVNLSWSGMLLATNFPLKIGDRLLLDFRLPDSDVPITVKAKVVHLAHGVLPEDATGIGVLFEELEPNIKRMIAGYVLENLPVD